MAIKGKRRTKSGRSGRRITTAPRPQIVIPKKPLLQRTWFRLTVLAFVLAGVAVWVVLYLDERREAQAAEEARREVERTGALIEGALALVGQPLPGGAGFQILPELSGTLAEIESEEAEAEEIESMSADWVQATEDADERLARIDTDNQTLRQSIEGMREALTMYGDVAARVPDALGLEKKELRDEVAAIQEDLAEATAAFDGAWFGYQAARQAVGLVDPAAGLPGGQVPPGFPPGGELPPGFPPEGVPTG